MSIPAVLLLGILTIVFGLIGSGTNEAAEVCAALFFPSALILYFAPTITALRRGHPNSTGIIIVDLFLGWTLVGWVVAFAWSHSAIAGKQALNASELAAQDDTRACPQCAETIKAAAVKCRFCGADVTPMAAPARRSADEEAQIKYGG